MLLLEILTRTSNLLWKGYCSVGPEPKLSRTCAENYKSDSCSSCELPKI